jgi:hypothetical protein
MKRFLSIPVAAMLLVSLHTVACIGGSDETSALEAKRAALRPAPPLSWGTTCIRNDFSSFATASDTKKTEVCFEQENCKTKKSERSGASFGGEAFYSSTYYSDTKLFIGTCRDKKPITCEGRERKSECDTCMYSRCCTEIAFCEDDPNCLALIKCMTDCNGNDACSKECSENAEPIARGNLAEALKCADSACSKACK